MDMVSIQKREGGFFLVIMLGIIFAITQPLKHFVEVTDMKVGTIMTIDKALGNTYGQTERVWQKQNIFYNT